MSRSSYLEGQESIVSIHRKGPFRQSLGYSVSIGSGPNVVQIALACGIAEYDRSRDRISGSGRRDTWKVAVSSYQTFRLRGK